MYLCLNNSVWKRVLIFLHALYKARRMSRVIIFPFIHSCFYSFFFSFFFFFFCNLINHGWPFCSLYIQIYFLNASKLDWDENHFDFFIESIAFKPKTFNLTINISHLFNGNMSTDIYLDQILAIWNKHM